MKIGSSVCFKHFSQSVAVSPKRLSVHPERQKSFESPPIGKVIETISSFTHAAESALSNFRRDAKIELRKEVSALKTSSQSYIQLWHERAQKSLDEKKDQLKKRFEELVVEHVQAICREVIGEELQHNSRSIVSRVKKVLQKLDIDECFKVQVHPHDEDIVRKEFNHVSASVATSSQIPPGNAVIETNSGCLELDVQRHARELTESLCECGLLFDKNNQVAEIV